MAAAKSLSDSNRKPTSRQRRGREAPSFTPSRGTKPRQFEEWSALRRWGQLPPWEPIRPGYLLREAREAAKLTQAELAKRLGVSQQAVAQAERADANPTVGLLETWGRALGIELRIELSPGGDRQPSATRVGLP